MESPIFSANKRHAMLFHRRANSQNQDIITTQFPNPEAAHLSPSYVSIESYHTPKTIEEPLPLSGATPPRPPPHRSQGVAQVRQPLNRSQSSEYFLEIRKTPAPKEPRSRKTDNGKIHTDATETQPAFESDAFAVQMPTTREPILDTPVFRAKLPSPSKAQVEAYHTYQQKAQQVRERNDSEGVRVPSKIVSYDYAYAANYNHPLPQPLDVDIPPPNSPLQVTPAGSFPISPPFPQHAWTRARQPLQVDLQGPRSTSDSPNISIARKLLGLGNNSSASPSATTPTRTRYHHRGDASTGASASASTPSPTPTPTKIKVRLKPQAAAATPQDRLQKESWRGLYNRSSQSSTNSSRSPSPSKSIPHSAYTTTGASAGAAEALFGYASKDITGTLAPAEKAKKKEKHDSKSRWAWLRPAGPRIAKPTATTTRTAPILTSSSQRATNPHTSIYTDPFIQLASPIPTLPPTPMGSRPASPRKLRAAAIPALHVEKGKVESSFAQVTSLGSLVLKMCLAVYVLVGLYFILDAIREAVHALGAPFRVVRMVFGYLWMGAMWGFGFLSKGWER